MTSSTWIPRVQQLSALAACVPLCAGSPAALAASPQILASPGPPLFARPIGGSVAGGSVGRGPLGGPLLGIEGSWATTLAVGGDPSEGAGAFGVRTGWAFINGIALHARYDDLGVQPASSRTPLQLATVGLRYSVPFLVPLPFAEVDAGPAFVVGNIQFGAGGGLGISVPIGPVLIDVVGRDWLVPIAQTVRQAITAGVGLSIVFPTPGRH